MKRASLKSGKIEAQVVEHSTLSIIIFTVNGKEYAFPVKPIQEIVNCTGYSELPANTGSAHGVVSLRGVGVPVFDFNAMLTGKSSVIGKRSCIIIIDVNDNANKKQSLGLLVDSVSVVLEIENDKIEDAPRVGDKSSADVFSKMVQLDGKFILILNESKLYSSLELKTNDNENKNFKNVSV